MNVEELKQKYRDTSLWKRGFILGVICLLPALSELLQTGQDLLSTQNLLAGQKLIIENKFKEAMKRKNEIPQLEELLSKTQSEMEAARKALPDDFHMDQVLEKTSILAEDNNVMLANFTPGSEHPSDTVFKYMELPIKIQATGSFGNVVKFFDRIVHMDLLAHIRDLDIRLDTSKKDITQDKSFEKLTIEQQQQLARDTTTILASCDMIV